MVESIYDIYNKAIKEQQQLATPTAPLSVLDEIRAYRNQLASIRQAEEQKKVQQMGFLNRSLQTAGDILGTLGKGIAKGVEGIADAGRLLRANITDVDDIRANMERKIAYDTIENSEYTQWLNRNTQGSYLNDTWLEGAIQSVGEMLPSVALNAIPGAGQALSTASFVTSAMGRGAEQALQEGATLEQATKYGVVSGTVEGIIEMASGGVAGVGSGWLSKAFPKVAGKVSTKLMTKPVARVAMSMIGEGFEEVASEFARPYMERIYKSKENIDPVTMENILQTFTIGALASGIMQSGMVAVTGRTNFRASLIEEQIQNLNEKITQETEKGTITPEKSKAYAEQQEALLGQLEETLGASVVVKDTAQQQTTPTEVKQEEAPKEILSTKSNTGEVYRQGDYVYKNSFRGNEKTLESEVYSALKNNDNVLSGEETTINGKQMIKTPYVENIISIDTIPLDERKNYGEIFSRDDINNIVNAINELSLLGYDYSDALQFAYHDGKFKLFDFSNVSKKTVVEATKNNYMYLYNFLRAFGLDNYANKIGKGMRIRNLLQTYSRESVESGKAFVLKENERNILKKLYRFNASPNNVYVTYNARTIPGVAQTDNLENGYRYIFTETPLTDKFIKEWELEPIFETKGRINRFNELINENVDNSKVSSYNDVRKGVKKDDISRVQSSIREGINKNDWRSTKSTKENGTIQRGNSREIQNQSEIKSKGNSTSSIHEHAIKQVNSQEFYDSLKQAKNDMKYSPFVDLHEVSDYQQNKNFLNEAKDAGFSITKDGNIVSVFKSDNSKAKKVLDTFIPMAIENGGNHLDCFNLDETGLAYLYEEYGFQPIAKLKFDRNYAPDGWDYDKWGEPDIVFMVHNGDNANTVKQKKGTYPHADLSKIDYVDSYDKGLEEYKKYIKTVEAPTEVKVVESLDDKLELIQDTDGKFNIRIKGTDIRLRPKNNGKNYMRNVYQQFKKEGTLDKIIESATKRTQSQIKEQESVKDDTKPKSKSSDSKTTKRATSKDTTRTSATVEQDVTTKQETEQETKQTEEVKQETEQEQPQVKRTGKEIFTEAKTNKKIIYVEKNRYNQTVYEVINPDAVPQELQPLVEKAKQYNTGLMFFYEEAQNGVITEGLFNYKERAIMINLASETPYEITLTHEIGHRQVATNRIKFNEMYQRFTQLSTKTKAKINELFGVYKDFYEENAEFFGNRQLNEEALFEEFLCNLGAGQVDLDALGIEASELTTLKDFDTEFKAEYLGEALQMDDTKNVLEIEKKLKTMPKYSLRKQTVEDPLVAESSTRGKVMVGNIKQKSTFGDTLTWFRRAFTNSMVDVENFFKRNGVANGEALTNKARAARNVGANMITNGIIEVEMEKGKITKITRKAPALAEVFGFLNNKSDNYKAAYFDYLLHRHNISRMDLPFKTKANAEQIAILTEARNKNEISQKLYDTLTNSNVTTSHSKVRDMIYEHEGKMTQTTLDTILDLMGDQKPVFGKNVTAQDSEAQVKKYEQTNPEFKAQAEKVYQYNNALLDEQVKAGLITRETADYFRRTYPNYVPTHRFPKGTSRSGLSVNTVQTGINTATGSERVIIDISEQMFNQTMKVSQAIAMNDMLKELGKNADGIDVQLYSEERITDVSQIDTEDVGKRNKFSYFDIDIDKNGKRVVKKKSILVSDGMADSIRSALPQTNSETTSKGIKYLRKANVSFKKLTTSLNPFFSFFRNPLRDMQNALIYTKYGIKTFAKNYGRAIREIRSNGAYYQAYLANGGEFSSFYNFEESVKVETKRKGIGKALNKLEKWSNMIEQYPRLAEFISSIEAGNSMEQALLDSADITVNFGRSGIITKWANGTFMPYFNARMQGALKFTRSFEGIMTRQGQKQLAFVLAKMVLLGIGTSLLNDFMYGDDDEYKEMRVDDKSNNFLFKIGGKWIKIPRAEVTTSLASVFNRSKEAREGDEQAFKGFTKDVWNSFSPVQNMRTIFSPIIDAKTNTTWYGGKIEGAKFDNVRPRDRYDESTSSIAKFIGQALNVSPKKVHYVLDQYSGILGDLILPATSQKYSTSVIGKNLTVDPTTSNKYSQRFYNALEEAQYDKSSGDMLAKGKVRFLNKAQDTLRELYNAQREVNNNTELSNKEKKEQYEVLQVMINNVQKNAVESLKRFSDVLSNFALTDDSFEEDYREATRITFGAETALMNYDKRIYEKAKALYEQGVPYDIYYCVYFDTKEFEGDFDYNGNYIKGSKQIMVWNYINRLNIPKAQKILLYEALGYTYSTKTSNATNDKNPFKAYGS